MANQAAPSALIWKVHRQMAQAQLASLWAALCQRADSGLGVHTVCCSEATENQILLSESSVSCLLAPLEVHTADHTSSHGFTSTNPYTENA